MPPGSRAAASESSPGLTDSFRYMLGALVGYISARLELAGFPASQIKLIGVKSKGSFVADHFSVMKTSPAAKAAIWKPADQLIDSVR